MEKPKLTLKWYEDGKCEIEADGSASDICAATVFMVLSVQKLLVQTLGATGDLMFAATVREISELARDKKHIFNNPVTVDVNAIKRQIEEMRKDNE